MTFGKLILIQAVLGSMFLIGCMAPDQTVGSGSSTTETELVDKAYAELMALDKPAALRKYSAYGGENAATNMVSCGDADKDGDSASFNLKMLDAQLDMAPSVGKILGIRDVDNCAKAKQFMEMKYEIKEGRPSPEMLLEGVTAAAEEALGKANIRGGVPENSLGKVLLQFDATASKYCTGSIIGPRAILTSAYCLDKVLIYNRTRVYTGIKPVTVKYFAPSNPTEIATSIASSSMRLIMHSAYAGDGDAEQDVGLIITDGPLPTSDFLKFYVGTMANGRRNRVYGAGLNAHSNTGEGVMRRGSEYVDWYGANHYYATESGAMQICRMDWGGPWVRDDGALNAITGTTSYTSYSVSGNCTGGGNLMRATRMNAKIGWIDAQLRRENAGSCVTAGDYAQCY